MTTPNPITGQLQGLFAGLMKGNKYTPIDIFHCFNSLSPNQRLSDLRNKYHVPVQSQFIKTATGKRVKEHWLEPFYIDGINNGSITPPNFYTGE